MYVCVYVCMCGRVCACVRAVTSCLAALTCVQGLSSCALDGKPIAPLPFTPSPQAAPPLEHRPVWTSATRPTHLHQLHLLCGQHGLTQDLAPHNVLACARVHMRVRRVPSSGSFGQAGSGLLSSPAPPASAHHHMRHMHRWPLHHQPVRNVHVPESGTSLVSERILCA